MKVFIWQKGLEILEDVHSVGQAQRIAEERGAVAVEVFPKQGGKREYRKDERSGRWYRA